ncbi:phosphoribosylamine--glycine ligase [Corynebacterium tapiri]|uniref:Phosphoribosylamine--glycine ligase n=1 Tax=Corynebacterium tapiri TaxID=1448266 RepID=A0A5C4U219_9CORY|nr:phosphoribosylamine--glycine ligase [Corynebacterium tapiri]TNL96090.1 phosphoribosylamine--glycine ligase [Corynebacterium tapiri]
MKTLVLGSGGREHALVAALHRDAHTTDLHCAPGNPGIAQLATCHAVDATDATAVVALAKELGVELAVIGPEAPLVAGVSDALREAGIAVFGPSQAAARLEGSKAFAKEVMEAAGVPTARAQALHVDTREEDIEAALDAFGPTYVVKDDGLAGGKGVVVTPDRGQARAHVDAVLAAGNPVLLESFLDGPEVSLFCLVDGTTVVPLLPAQDHKRAYDNDEGPNTGGMGAYTPLPWLPEGGVERIVREIAQPVAEEMVRRGTPYQGLLYVGAAWGSAGPQVVEFNARFGDPETQPVLSLLRSSLGQALHAVATGTLSEIPALEWEDAFAATVVVAAEGYPESPRKGDPISGEGLNDASQAIHAGTKLDGEQLVSAGGRVLSVMGKGKTLQDALAAAYERVDRINLPGSFVRRDIGAKAARGEVHIPSVQ